MEDEMEMLFTSGTNYLESLFNCRKSCLPGNELLFNKQLLNKLDEVIGMELDLALLGAEKAKEKATKNKDNIKEFKK